MPGRSGSPWSRAPGGRPGRRPGARDRAGSRAGGRPGRRRRRGTRPRRPRSAGRRPTPSRPARRRAGPRRRSGSARATRAFAPWTATDPDAVRVGFAGAGARTGAVRITGRPSSRKPGPSGKVRRLPRRSSSVSVCRSRSTATISPHQSVVTSSTTAPSSAGASTARPRFGAPPVGGEHVGAVAVAGHPVNARRRGTAIPGHAAPVSRSESVSPRAPRRPTGRGSCRRPCRVVQVVRPRPRRAARRAGCPRRLPGRRAAARR